MKAIELAEELDARFYVADSLTMDAAAELRRLAEVNADLLQAAKHAMEWFNAAGYQVPASAHLYSAISKAEGRE